MRDVHVGIRRSWLTGWDVAHRVLGHRRDREARVDPDVGRDRRAVADQQVLVAERPLAAVDHAERATGRRLVGLLIGLAGVVVLMGIDVAGKPDELLGAAAIRIAASDDATCCSPVAISGNGIVISTSA